MCGICGIFDREFRCKNLINDRRWIYKMTDTLRHRGPDRMDTFRQGPIALGNARLAIIDLSASADQPMILEDGAYAITFNGEIYNYIELREDLEADGVRFKTGSDTEVLLRLYMRNGSDCLQDLRGMFAFAIWDRPKKSLFLARDRAGEKPLVYSNQNGMFFFASEIKSLLALPQIKRKIDPVGLHYGLHYVTVPAPYSAFEGIRKLRPSEYMIVSSDRSTTQCYWQPTYRSAQLITDPEEAVHEFNTCLDKTVKIISRSDVAIGATLSGGLDSSAVVASMHHNAAPIDTFCVSSGETDTDREFSAARTVAAHFHTNHHELTFQADQLSNIRQVIRSYDEPFASFVPLHAHSLASLIGTHVKVALTGNGGDELYGGYPDHQHLQTMERKLQRWYRLEKLRITPCLQLLPWAGLQHSRKKYKKLRQTPINRIVAEIHLSKRKQFFHYMYSDRMKSQIGTCDPANLLIEKFDEFGASRFLDGFLFQQLMVGSQHSIVDIPDTSGMAHSLEYRSPFLDVKMIELALRIPVNLNVRISLKGGMGKLIIRKAMASRLPAEIVWMKKKGFGSAIPYHKWIISDWQDYIRKKLGSSALKECGLFNIDKLKGFYEQAQISGQAPVESFWGIIMVAEWLDTYFSTEPK